MLLLGVRENIPAVVKEKGANEPKHRQLTTTSQGAEETCGDEN